MVKLGYYKIKGDKVYYHTKTGKQGSMPKGHVNMVKKWGLKLDRSPVKKIDKRGKNPKSHTTTGKRHRKKK